MNDSLNQQLMNRFLDSINWGTFSTEFQNSVANNVWEKIKKELNEKDPILLQNFSKLYEEFESIHKEIDRKMKIIDKKLKKLTDSESLCEDVYKLRDEMKNIKSFVEKFEAKAKKLFS